MAFEKILEFGEGNRYKVKFEVGNVDTSTVDDVELDEEIASLQKEDDNVYSFNVRELYSAEGEHEVLEWHDDYRGGGFNGGGFDLERVERWSCDYSVDRYWDIALVDGELSVENLGEYGDMEFDNEYFPEGLDRTDFESEFETDAKYDVLITYEKLENEENKLDNLFSDSDKDELEKLKVDIKDNYYSVASAPVEVDWEMCKAYAKEAGVSDEYLTEANLNRALEITLQNIALDYTNAGDCFVLIKGNLIHIGTNIAEYEPTAEEDIETIGKLTLEKDDLGIMRLYVSGEMQDDLSKASEYKEVITRIWSYVTWFKQEKVKADTYIQEINAKIKNILPSLMERILNLSEVDKNKEWIVKKLGLAKELEQTVGSYLSAKREMRQALEDDSLKKLKVDTTALDLLNLDALTGSSLRAGVGFLTAVLGDLQVGKSSFSMLQVAEISFEEALKMESGTCSLVLREIRSSLEKLLSEHSDNEKMAQEIEEALTLTKQPKVITAEAEMVSAWNKYIGLKMEK